VNSRKESVAEFRPSGRAKLASGPRLCDDYWCDPQSSEHRRPLCPLYPILSYRSSWRT
jgi:hypothetical protein